MASDPMAEQITELITLVQEIVVAQAAQTQWLRMLDADVQELQTARRMGIAPSYPEGHE
jgi:hypothetical protein